MMLNKTHLALKHLYVILFIYILNKLWYLLNRYAKFAASNENVVCNASVIT